MELIWMILILLTAIVCAVVFGKTETKKSLEELETRAIQFGEECYIQGMIPIQKVKQFAQFYLVQESNGRVSWEESVQRIEKRLEEIQK